MHSITALNNADDTAELIRSLKDSEDISRVRNGLVRAVIFLRIEKQIRGARTESVAALELAFRDFFECYGGTDFEEIYPLLRELVRLIPKFQIFGIDIAELRDIVHDFDAEYRYDDIFRSIASDIRKLTHQNLSERVIKKLEEFSRFLQSDEPSGIIDGSIITGATRGAKEKLYNSDHFKNLLKLKDKLRIAWTSESDKREKVYSQVEFVKIIKQIIDDLSSEEISRMPGYLMFLDYFVESLEDLRAFKLENIPIGRIRYYLKKFIEQIIRGSIKNKGAILFRLITIDTLLEQVSFIYYSNIVNSVKVNISEDNYFDTLSVLFELALCTRAVGHGTKHLGRFAFLLENILKQMKNRPDRAAHFPTIIDAMNSELENYFVYLQELYFHNIDTENMEKKFSMVNRILNNLIREKTTHLLGNMINNLKTYHERKEMERFNRLLSALGGLENLSLDNFVYHFGTDIEPGPGVRESPEFMGGKGFSLVMSSKIILQNNLTGIDVPKGSGFSTLTWYYIKESRERRNDFRMELENTISGLEKRTKKTYGSSENPLLLIARSGAVISMPGIMDTISHIGLNMDITDSWASKIDEPVRAYHAYVNFILSYAKSILNMSPDRILKSAGLQSFEDLYSNDIDKVKNNAYSVLKNIQSLSHLKLNAIPEEPFEQIYYSALAVFRSYENELVYRQSLNYGIPEEFQTSCIVQECLPVMSSEDCSGVLFTRNPATGRIGSKYEEHIEYRDGYFGNVIADGTMKPFATEQFVEKYPGQYEVLKKFKYHDEREQRYPTDIEFAVRNGIVYVVQSRILKQSPAALIMNSYDFYREGIYSPFKLIKRTAFSFNKEIIETYIDSKVVKNAPVIAHGRPVTGGAVCGRLIRDHNKINKFDGRLIFITESNVPPDVIMKEQKIAGYISKEGGITSHAALVAISEHKPCVTDVKWIAGETGDDIVLGATNLKEGGYITLDANTGNIYQGDVPIIESTVIDEEYRNIKGKILSVIDELVSEV